MKRSPTSSIILDTPHAGKLIPSIVKPYLRLSEEVLDKDRDHFVHNIFGGLPIEQHIDFAINRAILDVNRLLNDFGADGIVKIRTMFKELVFKGLLPFEVQRMLIDDYAKPYYKNLHQAFEEGQSPLVIFGHSMPAEDTSSATCKVAPKEKPLFVLGNGGREDGETTNPHGVPGEILRAVKEEIIKLMRHGLVSSANINENNIVGLSSPYPGAMSIKRIPDKLWTKKKGLLIEVRRDIVADNLTLIQETIAMAVDIVLKRLVMN